MAIEITMPRLSDTMEMGTIVAWNVKEGDEVSAGDVLADIETDKATMELQNFDDGVIASILLAEGKETEVGAIMAVLAEEGEDPAEIKAQYAGGAPAKAAASAPAAEAEASAGGGTAVAAPPATDTTTDGDRIFVSPLARKIAAEYNLDLGTVTGTGPSGRIVRRDVESAVANGAPVSTPAPAAAAPAPRTATPTPATPVPTHLESTTVSLTNMRKTIARRLVESKQTIPHYQVTVAVDMDPILELRKQLNEQLASQGVKLSVNDFLVRACALAMHQHPHINASWGSDDASIMLHGDVNVGVAVALSAEQGGGLVVATLRHADRMGLRQISADTKAMAGKARDKGLSIDEMSDATFTISNLGMFGVEHFTAIVNPPNSAILAVGQATQKPVVRDGEIVIGHEMQMTMSSDHRVIDGAMAAQYLATVREFLEKPATLLV